MPCVGMSQRREAKTFARGGVPSDTGTAPFLFLYTFLEMRRGIAFVIQIGGMV
jgi:hypothetical protein